jgi:IclR family acetate operon transcriptional repressor
MSTGKRIVQILDLLSQRGQMGVRAISQQLDVPVSSMHRLLLELAGEGVIERLQDGEWDMSYRMLAITSNQLERMELPILAQPFCTAISEKTNESTKVNGLMGLATVCLLRVSGNKGVQVDFKVGARSASLLRWYRQGHLSLYQPDGTEPCS